MTSSTNYAPIRSTRPDQAPLLDVTPASANLERRRRAVGSDAPGLATRTEYYDPGMTDETDKRDGVASRVPLWALAILAAVAFGAYAYFILDF
jgi:hypothetical protein